MTYQMFPPAPAGTEIIHTRRYEVRTYRVDATRFVLRGVVVDEKPPGLYVDGDDEPLWVHHMVVDLEVAYPSFVIEKVSVTFNEHPYLRCGDIEPDYQGLVGVSIARGYTKKVKDLFGGPRGCTHIGALLAAMGPVAIQSGWSMRAGTSAAPDAPPPGPEESERARTANLNTCHMWDEEGDLVAGIAAGETLETPVWITRRLAKLGRDPSEWEGWR